MRSALLRWLDSERGSDPSTLTIQELSLFGQVRVDVAVVNGFLSGFELKSELDTLRRLPAQAEAYSRVFDLMTLVVAEKHHEKAIELVPKWWGIVIASTKATGVSLEFLRQAERNPSVDSHSVVKLLWRGEALEELEHRGAATGFRSKTRSQVWHRLAELLPEAELRGVVRRRLKSRPGWRVGLPRV